MSISKIRQSLNYLVLIVLGLISIWVIVITALAFGQGVSREGKIVFKPYTRQQFTLTLDGAPKSLTLKGISTPRLMITADISNLDPCYIGNVFENGNGAGQIATLNGGNNIDSLVSGQIADYTDMQQFDRLPRTRNFYIERNRLHVMSEWFVQGSVGDIVYVTWYWDGQPFLDLDTQQPVNISNLNR